jgi:hypothetical protein
MSSNDNRPHSASGALFAAAAQFREYARQHRAKQTPEATVKAEVNDKMAEMCEQALAQHEDGRPVLLERLAGWVVDCRTDLRTPYPGGQAGLMADILEVVRVADRPGAVWTRQANEQVRDLHAASNLSEDKKRTAYRLLDELTRLMVRESMRTGRNFEPETLECLKRCGFAIRGTDAADRND